MLRRTLVAASQSEALRRVATDVDAARNVALRFVAGETLDDAIRVTSDLNDRGVTVTLDYLGEAVHDAAKAEAAAATYLDALERLDADGLECGISVKPTQVGLDVSTDLCLRLLGDLCARAGASERHVTIDMESSDYTQATVDLVLALRAQGHEHVGCAVQSYLHRTADDVAKLVADGASLRLCKGAYAEPEEVTHQDKADVDANYVRLADRLLRSGIYQRFATHDHRIIAQIRNLAVRHGIGDDAYEFQMLYGVREPLQQEMVDKGHNVRIYVPFGDEWFPYLTRRLAERPANLTFFLRALTGKRA